MDLGQGDCGEDVISATWLHGVPDTCPPAVLARIEWTPVKISLLATDPAAAEPATPGGPGNTGTITFTRIGNVSQALTVPF